jgi:galactoside O-acetyltransferase
MSNLYSIEDLKNIGVIVYGKNIKISKFVNIYNPKNLILHDNIRIDDFCIISCKGTIEIFNNVHISAQCFVSSATNIIFGNYSGISVGVKLFGGCDDFSGEYLTNPTIPNKYTNVIIGDIILKDHVLIGSNSIVLPNVILAEGTAIGSNSLVKKSTNEWKIYGGVPIKEIKDRSRNCLELQCEYENEIKLNI